MNIKSVNKIKPLPTFLEEQGVDMLLVPYGV